jgi:hypothetical protein
MGREGAFWGKAADKVLRYQSAINRQLAKAIEQLEDRQAERNSASTTSERFDSTDNGDGADKSGEMPVGPISGDGQPPTPAASGNVSATCPGHVEASSQAITAQSLAPANSGVFSSPAALPDRSPKQAENYKTNPTTSGGGNNGTPDKGAGGKRTLLELINRKASLATPQDPNHSPVPMPRSGTISQYASSSTEKP